MRISSNTVAKDVVLSLEDNLATADALMSLQDEITATDQQVSLLDRMKHTGVNCNTSKTAFSVISTCYP